MISAFISRLVILVFGTLYPAYASYKAVRTKDVKEYVKWMMYWIVFALFTCAETVTDVLLNWLPFYYEIKIVWVVWLLSPATKGSSILYRKFVHPTLSSREQEIDEYINRAKEQSYRQFLDLGTKGVSALMQTAIKGGGGLVNQLKKSYSLSDLSNPEQVDGNGVVEMRLLRRRDETLYYSQMDLREELEVDSPIEDVGYSSGDCLPPKLQAREGLSRAASLTRNTRSTTKATRSKKDLPSDEIDASIHKEPRVLLEPESSEEDFRDCLDVVHELSKVTACKNVTEERGGKYNKKIAPKPPPDQASAIKATLVLKPGIVRATSQQKEIFINSSPKVKRRQSSLSKLLNVPKTFHLWKKHESISKRASWHEIHKQSLDSLQIDEAKFKSKSDNNLAIDKKVVRLQQQDRQSLTESPVAKRRLKIIRRYVDEDID